MISSAYVQGGHGIPLDSNCFLGQFQSDIKSVKWWCGDNDIILQVVKRVNERDNENEIQTKQFAQAY